MGATQKHIILIAGEASGDMHAARLVDALRQLDPSLTFSGLGGQNMLTSGVRIHHDLTKLAVVGFIEVFRHYSELRKIFRMILKKIRDLKPLAVILVDYPGFNLRLAKKIKKMNTKVIYYISPQVWAWKENRVHEIKKNVDAMLVLFQFEKKFYGKYGVNVHFVGHPLIDTVVPQISKDKFLHSHGLKDYQLTIGLLPGSREKRS